jgi:hypothetical protein
MTVQHAMIDIRAWNYMLTSRKRIESLEFPRFIAKRASSNQDRGQDFVRDEPLTQTSLL